MKSRDKERRKKKVLALRPPSAQNYPFIVRVHPNLKIAANTEGNWSYLEI